ncbi:DUF1501 domain-containing protein [Hydrogenophaga sp.]|uniref:DUF1501 domain-containing protein n=1 Tax=Hydrogenophaga sp. TaxID=1904254 RepID=UPI003562FFE4
MSHHTNPLLALNRRRWLQFTGTTLAGALGATGLSALLPAAPAQAQSAYKALVCVFLYGGNDGMNTVVPTDLTRHNQYAGVRGELALPRSSLVGLSGTDLGLHPAMAALSSAWSEGSLAPVLNVGPLYAPMSKSEYRNAAAGSSLIPDSLFSHADQQVLWEAASTDALERTGWGGRAAATLGTTNPVISLGGSGRFGLSAYQPPLVLPEPGATFGLEGLTDTSWAPVAARKTALEAMYADAQANTLLNTYGQQQRDAFAVATRLGDLVKVQPGSTGSSAAINNAFAPITADGKISTGIGKQLYQVAKLVEGRAVVQGDRQIFFAQQGGYDTHGDQIASTNLVGAHAGLLKALADAMACFHNAMKAIGQDQGVTLFTQSDFGRTFKPNSSKGTDHAWGNHHLVLGGAVKGNATYGTYPELVLGGANDVGVDSWERHGRWIPAVGVDQYAATLLSWLGASSGQLATVLPNLKNFSQKNLGFV